MPFVEPLTPTQRELLRRGVGCFNRAQFFECHEILEEAWREAPSAQKPFLQGMIQIAVALHHALTGNVAGSRRLLPEGVNKVRRFAPRHEDVDVAALIPEVERVGAALKAGMPPGGLDLPKISYGEERQAEND